MPEEAAWELISQPAGDIFALDAHAEHAIAVIARPDAYRLLHSADGGRSWQSAWEDLPADFLVTAVGAAEDGVYVGLLKGGVFAGRYGDASWRVLGDGLPPEAAVSALAAADDCVFAGTRGHGLFVCAAGEDWRRLEISEGRRRFREGITSLATAAEGVIVGDSRHFTEVHRDGTIRRMSTRIGFAAPAGVVRGGFGRLVGWTGRAVAYSDDQGATWVGLPDPPLQDACIRSVAAPGAHVFVGLHGRHEAGVLRYSGRDRTWEVARARWPSPSWSVVVCAVPGALLAGVGGSGIYRLPMTDDDGIAGAPAWNLEAGAASGGVRITLESPEEVRVEICGPDNSRMRSMRLGILGEGPHDVTIDDGSIPPGIYTCTVAAGGVSRSIQCIILR